MPAKHEHRQRHYQAPTGGSVTDGHGSSVLRIRAHLSRDAAGREPATNAGSTGEGVARTAICARLLTTLPTPEAVASSEAS
jgi:hypothetical protein